MYPYPREYPSAAVKILLDFVSKTDDIEKKDAIHASWVLAGYALSRMYGGGPAIIGTKKQKPTKLPVSDLKRKEFVEQFIKSYSYGTLKKFEEANPSCWAHLYQLAKVMSDAV